MKIATIRDLRYDFRKVEAWLDGGEDIMVTKHSKPVCYITQKQPSVTKKRPPRPDFEARRRRIWGDRVFSDAEVEEMRVFETGEP